MTYGEIMPPRASRMYVHKSIRCETVDLECGGVGEETKARRLGRDHWKERSKGKKQFIREKEKWKDGEGRGTRKRKGMN